MSKIWIVRFEKRAEKELLKLPDQAQERIRRYLKDILQNPKQSGQSLAGPLKDLWRYRVGDYRIICEIREREQTIIIARVAHRREVYQRTTFH